MKLKILKKYSNIKNCFILFIDTSSCDIEEVSSFNLKFNLDQKENLSRCLLCLEQCKLKYENYKEIPNFIELFNEFWPQDNFIEDYYLYFYDENGIKYDVEIEFSEEEIYNINNFKFLNNNE